MVMPSRRTRVAIVTEVFLPKVDGIVNTVLRIVDGLSSRGVEILLLTPGGYRNAYPGVRIVQTRSVPCPIYPGLRLGWPDSWLVRALLEFEPDAIHLAGPTVLGARLAPIAAAIAPTVSTYHTSLAAYAYHYRLAPIAGPVWGWLRHAHNACAATLCPSRATRDDLVKHRFDRVRIWSRGVDALRFDPPRRSAAGRADLGVAPIGHCCYRSGGSLRRSGSSAPSWAHGPASSASVTAGHWLMRTPPPTRSSSLRHRHVRQRDPRGDGVRTAGRRRRRWWRARPRRPRPHRPIGAAWRPRCLRCRDPPNCQ
jgi:hypothetical protein